MRKILFALGVVSLLAVGVGTKGEAGEYTGCIDQIGVDFFPQGIVGIVVRVGDKFLKPTVDGMSMGTVPSLPYAQLATLEPILAPLRAGAAAKVKARVQWDDATKRVTKILVRFWEPCK